MVFLQKQDDFQSITFLNTSLITNIRLLIIDLLK